MADAENGRRIIATVFAIGETESQQRQNATDGFWTLVKIVSNAVMTQVNQVVNGLDRGMREREKKLKEEFQSVIKIVELEHKEERKRLEERITQLEDGLSVANSNILNLGGKTAGINPPPTTKVINSIAEGLGTDLESASRPLEDSQPLDFEITPEMADATGCDDKIPIV